MSSTSGCSTKGRRSCREASDCTWRSPDNGIAMVPHSHKDRGTAVCSLLAVGGLHGISCLCRGSCFAKDIRRGAESMPRTKQQCLLQQDVVVTRRVACALRQVDHDRGRWITGPHVANDHLSLSFCTLNLQLLFVYCFFVPECLSGQHDTPRFRARRWMSLTRKVRWSCWSKRRHSRHLMPVDEQTRLERCV